MGPSSRGSAHAIDLTLREDLRSALARQFSLSVESSSRLVQLGELLVSDPLAPTAVRDLRQAVDDHVADSLVALEVPEVARACSLLDIGSGAGLPALPLAVAVVQAQVVALDSQGRKTAFISRAIGELGISNARALTGRAEEIAMPGSPEREAFDVVTARALAPLNVVAEWAAPLLRAGGVLVAWRGRRDPAAEAEAEAAAPELGLEAGPVLRVAPHARAEHRHLHLLRKVGPTPERFPRRAGMARKRPLGSRASV